MKATLTCNDREGEFEEALRDRTWQGKGSLYEFKCVPWKKQISVVNVGQGEAITRVGMAATRHHEVAEILTHVKITPKVFVRVRSGKFPNSPAFLALLVHLWGRKPS